MEKAVTYMTLIPVMAGIILATGFEPSFNTFGFLAAVGACGARALKAVLQVNSAPQIVVVYTSEPRAELRFMCFAVAQ